MKNGLVTVVVPIYNVERYLDKCIKSISEQSYKDLEILLIDDGSTDKSGEICDKWASVDTRIRVIHKENEGQGIARNVGIANANGAYICFFDSDDYIAERAIEKAYSLAKKEESEVVVFGFDSVDNDGNLLMTYIPEFEKNSYSGDDVKNVFFPEYLAPDPKGDGKCKFYMSAWLGIYSLNLIKRINWRFVSEREIISEDVYSLISLFSHVKKVSILPEALYYYRNNNTSFSKSYDESRYGKVRHFYLESKKLCERLKLNDKTIHRLSKSYLGYTIDILKQESSLNDGYRKTKKHIKSIVDDDVLQTVLEENKKDKVGFVRATLFFAIRNKLYGMCILLLNGKQMISRVK
ncbi:MAG: glycosyltransferase family 2 protein [Clostridia bacterium]|nr:glycosyltransferase family 2 protein [Clostridia bacterium]